MAGQGQLPVDDEVRELAESVDKPLRAVKLLVDPRRPRLIPKDELAFGKSLLDDLPKVVDMLGDTESCAILLKLKDEAGTVPGALDSDWVVITYIPDGASQVEQKQFADCGNSSIEVMLPSRVKELSIKKKADLTKEAVLKAAAEVAAMPAPDLHNLGVFPLDVHNKTLIDNVHPLTWKNPVRGDDFVYDIIAVGGGAAGLVTAKQSARRGAKSALIEYHLAGGDCLNVGCVPSKALLRCARSAYEQRRGDMAVKGTSAEVDFPAVMERMRRLRAKIAPVDSHEQTVAAGADVYQDKAVFTGKNTLTAGGQTLRFKKAVICTGAKARVPPIPGLAEVPYITNSTLFNLTELPPRFAVLGAGPIGLEMAQAFGRFGSKVTVLEGLDRILGPEDPDAAKIVNDQLLSEGMEILCSIKVKKIEHTDSKPFPEIRITVDTPDKTDYVVVCDAFLVATGRAPNVEGLGLEAAGVDFKPPGVVVNDDLSTSNPDIFAIGDVTDRMEFKFTHTAGSMAGMAVQNALFPGDDLPVNAPSRLLSEVIVPRVTYTEPEVASCGIGNQRQADMKGVEVDIYTSALEHNDRAILEGSTEGLVKIICAKGTDKILGGTVVADRAGDMLAELTLAAQNGVGMAALGRTIHPYPTMGEALQQCALAIPRKTWRRYDAK